MKTRVLGLLLILALLAAPGAAFAAVEASPWTQNETYADRVTGKLQFGITNTLLGWIDLFYEPNRYANEKKNIWAGVGKGLVDALVNTVGGAFQLVTFPIPVDFPLPEGGIDLGG
jgi:hypothetical protein